MKLVHQRPKPRVVIEYMGTDPEEIGTEVRRIAGDIVSIADAAVRCQHDGGIDGILDQVAAFSFARIAAQSAFVMLSDPTVREVLPAFRVAWGACEASLTPDEADKILRDPAAQSEPPEVTVLRDAWLPLRDAAQAALNKAREPG